VTAVAGDPQALRVSARTLSDRSAHLHEAARTVRRHARRTDSAWQGTASVRFVAASGRAVRALGAAGDGLSEIAAATQRYASELDSAQRRAGELARRRDAAEQDLRIARCAPDGRGSGTGRRDPDPVAVAAALVRALTSAGEDVVHEQVAAARRFRSVLDRSHLGPDILSWVDDATAPARAIGKAVKVIRQVDTYASFLRHLAGARQALEVRDLWRQVRHLRGAGEQLRKITHGPFSHLAGPARRLSRAARLLAKLTPALTFYRGVSDAATGAGYTGWRGTTTRVLGGLAAGAAIVGVTPIVAYPPVGLTVGGILLAHNAWKAGNWAHDHRAQLRSAAVKTYRAARRVGEQIVRTQVAAFRRGVSLARSFAHLHQEVWKAGVRKSGVLLQGVATISPDALGALRRAGESGARWRQELSGVPKTLGPVAVRPGPVDRLTEFWKDRETCPGARFWPSWAPSPLLKPVYPLVCRASFGAGG
jgi:uncharacterized protein YukE